MKISSRINNRQQSEHTANKILFSGIKLFVERGYHGTSIDGITRAAGVTKGAFYWHFKSKEELLKRVIKEFEKRYVDGLISTVQKVNGGPAEKLDEYIRYSAAFAYNNRELVVSFTTLSAELLGATPHHEVESDIRRVYKKHQDFLSRLIESGKENNVFKKESDSELVALVIMAFHDGVLLHWSMNRGKIAGVAYVDTYKNIIKNGLLTS